MSNLKKILALVLALVMSFSLVSVSSAAMYEDEDKIGADYIEAVTVLTNLGIFQGDNGNFKPTDFITRQEVAAMMYRVISTDVTDKNDGLYVDACKFTDVTANWSKGYIGYCANGGYIKGVGDNKFDPQGNISGVAVLAMILRAVGYDKNGEFTGSDWDYNVLTVATSLGILAGIDESVESLKKPATRQLVAELIFRAMVKATKVTYTPAFSYQPVVENIGVNNLTAQPATIGYDNFKLLSKEVDSVDTWGNPNHNWVCDANNDRTATVADLTPATIMGTFGYAPVATYTAATKECEVAHALGYKVAGEKTINTVVNGQALSTVDVNAIDTITTIGGQGRLTKVFDYVSRVDGLPYEKITMVDTFLAKVVGVTVTTRDNAGHIKTYSTLTLDVYDDGAATEDYNVVLYSGANWTYSVGDMVLVNAITTGATAGNTATNEGNVATIASSMVLGLAESFVGAQTIIWNNLNKHTINGVDYNDANTFNHDEAGTKISNHTWYKDTYGNVIGSAEITTIYNYGVLVALWWANDGTNYGKGTAYGMIKYMDGTTTTAPVEIAAINGLPTYYALNETVGANQGDGLFYVSTYNVNNEDLLYTEMYKIQTLSDGSIALYETAELANAKIQNKVSVVTGTPVEVNNYQYNATTKAYDAVPVVATSPIYADNFTQYMILNTVTGEFTNVTGIDNIANFTKTANVIDYVDFDADGWVDYVYIIGNSNTSNSYEFVYVTNETYSSNLYTTANGIQYYTIYGVVHTDGSNEPLKVLATDGAALKAQMTQGTDTLYLVTKNPAGYVTAAEVVTNVGTTHPVSGAFAMYMGDGAKYDSRDGANGVLVVGGEYFNVNAANTLVVDEDQVGGLFTLTQAGLKNKYVYVISNASQTIASAVFLSDKAGISDATAVEDDVEKAFAEFEAALKELKDAIAAAKEVEGYTAATTSEHAAAIERIVAAEADVETKKDALNAAIAADTTLTDAEKAEIALAQSEVQAQIDTYLAVVDATVAAVATAGVATLKADIAVATGDDLKALQVMAYELSVAMGDAGCTVSTADIADAITEGGKLVAGNAKETAAEELKALAEAAMAEFCADEEIAPLLIYVTGIDTALKAVIDEATKADSAFMTAVAEATDATVIAGLIEAEAADIVQAVWNAVYDGAKKAVCEYIDSFVGTAGDLTLYMTAAEKDVLTAAKKAAKDIILAAEVGKVPTVSSKAWKEVYNAFVNINVARMGSTITVKVPSSTAVVTVAAVKEVVKELALYDVYSVSLNADKTVATIVIAFGSASATLEVPVVKVVG